MPNPVVYHAKIFKDSEYDIDESKQTILTEYIGVPVRPIKVVLHYSQKPEINHFERAILSLLIHDYFSNQELSDKLLLNIELVELIVDELVAHEYLTNDLKVTVKGQETLTGVYSTIKSTIAYIFYDLAREQIFEKHISSSELSYGYTYPPKSSQESSNNEDDTNQINHNNEEYIKIETDAFNKTYLITPVPAIVKSHLSKKHIEKLLKQKWSGERDLISLDVLNIEKKHLLLTKIETEVGNIYKSNWKVKCPFDNDIDLDLNAFIHRLSYEETALSHKVKALMEKRYHRSLKVQNNVLHKPIINSLFHRKIHKNDEVIVGPLAKVLSVLKDSTKMTISQAAQIHYQKVLRDAHLHLADLFESVLYLAAEKQGFKIPNSNLIKMSAKDNMATLKNIATNMGFNVNKYNERLLIHDRKSLNKITRRPDKAILGSCIAWNLFIAFSDSNYYFNYFAKDHPNFIQQMYEYKREIRDKTRHSLNTIKIKPKTYIDTLFDLFDKALGYKVNEQVLDDLTDSHSFLNDYSLSEETIKPIIGEDIHVSNDASHTKFRQSLISAYENYLNKNSSYLTELRSIFEDFTSNILNDLVKKYNIKNLSITELINSSSDLKMLLSNQNFNTEQTHSIPIDFQQALSIHKSTEYLINRGIKDQFQKTNLSYKVQTLILIMNKHPDSLVYFGGAQPSVPNLFTSILLIMYLDKEHKQVKEFNQEHADVVIHESLRTIKSLIKNAKLNLWG